MRFSILKAGTATRAGRERVGDVDRMFIDLLSFPGSSWDSHDVEHGVFPGNVADYDGFVITGGPAGAHDQDEWVLRLLDTVREAHSRRVRLLGVCLGHHVVALALGGEVGVNPNGWEMGLTPIELTPAGLGHPTLASAPRPLRLLQTHRDIVTRLPADAVHLASSEKTAYEMFQLGDSVFGMQGHPEMDNEELRQIIRRREKHLPPEVVSQGLASLSGEAHRDFLQSALQAFLRGEGFELDRPSAAAG